MFKINGILAITNGVSPSLKVHDKKGTYANGTEYFIINDTITVLLISTDKIINDIEDEQEVLKVIEEGKLDFWPLTTFRGWKNVQNLKDRILKGIEEKKQREERKKHVDELESKYPQVPVELKTRVYNLDHFHQYSDDGRVYRNAEEMHELVRKDLENIDSLQFYKDYVALIWNTK